MTRSYDLKLTTHDYSDLIYMLPEFTGDAPPKKAKVVLTGHYERCLTPSLCSSLFLRITIIILLNKRNSCAGSSNIMRLILARRPVTERPYNIVINEIVQYVQYS